jgi:hypothetical protein
MRTPEYTLNQLRARIAARKDTPLTDNEIGAIEKALPGILAKESAVLQRVALNAEIAKLAATPIKQQIAVKKAADKAKQEARAQAVKACLDSKREDLEAEVKAEKARLAAKKITDAEREEHRKAELKEWKKQSAALAESRTEQGIEQARCKEANRASAVKAIIERVGRVLSDADALYADLKPFRNPKVANDAEKEQIGKALDAASKRCTSAKRLLY